MVGFTILFGTSFAQMSILSDQDIGFLKEILVPPVSCTSIILRRIVGGSTTALVQAVLILFVSIRSNFMSPAYFWPAGGRFPRVDRYYVRRVRGRHCLSVQR